MGSIACLELGNSPPLQRELMFTIKITHHYLPNFNEICGELKGFMVSKIENIL